MVSQQTKEIETSLACQTEGCKAGVTSHVEPGEMGGKPCQVITFVCEMGHHQNPIRMDPQDLWDRTIMIVRDRAGPR